MPSMLDANATMLNVSEAISYRDDEVTPAFFLFAKYITMYLQPVICIVGFLGNFTAFCVFLSRPMRNISSNLYLAALSCSSYGFNLVLFCQWLEFVNVPLMHTQGFCQTIVYLGYIFSFLSVWLIVCITVENYIVTFHLSKAVVYCTVFRAKVIISVLTLYSLILYSGQFWTTRVIEVRRVYDNSTSTTNTNVVFENYTLCTEVNDYAQLNRIYSFWDTLTTMVVPIIITSVLIVAILVKNLCVVANTTGHENCFYRRLSKKQKSLVRITRVLLAISLTFVILSGPSHANKLRHLIQTELYGNLRPTTLSDRILQQIFQIIYYLSSCLNIIYYSIWSHNFRTQIRRILCLQNSRSNRSLRSLELQGYACHQKQTVMESSVKNTGDKLTRV